MIRRYGNNNQNALAEGSAWGSITGDIEEQNDLITKFGNKVDKEAGKGLSANDFTTDEQSKLSGIEDGAQVNIEITWGIVKDKPTTFPPESHTHSGMIISSTITEIVSLTQTAYNALTPVATKLYIITGA